MKGTNIKLRFIHSFVSMLSSLEKIIIYLNKGEKKITRIYSKNNDEFNLLTTKAVFSYNYINSWENAGKIIAIKRGLLFCIK